MSSRQGCVPGAVGRGVSCTGVQCASDARYGESRMSTHTKYRFVLGLGCALAMIPATGFSASAAGRSSRQNSGQGSSGSGQQQSKPQTRPASKPQPGQPGDRPTIQPVPSPGKPTPGKPQPGQPQPGKPQPGKPSPGKPSPGNPQPGKPQPGKPSPGKPTQPLPGKPGYRPPPPSHGRPPSVQPRPPYHWRPNDRDYLRRYYRRNLGYINRSHRPVFVIGGYIPFGYRGYFTPVPGPLLGYLPPPPPGYVIAYYNGYCVVYDPVTFTILSVVDLLD